MRLGYKYVQVRTVTQITSREVIAKLAFINDVRKLTHSSKQEDLEVQPMYPNPKTSSIIPYVIKGNESEIMYGLWNLNMYNHVQVLFFHEKIFTQS